MRYLLDINKSEIYWKASKSSEAYSGTVLLKQGTIMTENGKIFHAEIVADMNSIQVSDDLERDEKERFEKELKENFFPVKEVPVASFKLVHADRIPEPEMQNEERKYSHTIEGDLTINNFTQRVKFPVLIVMDGEKFEVQAKFNIDRTKFNIGLWYDESTGEEEKVNPEVEIGFYLIALYTDTGELNDVWEQTDKEFFELVSK